MAILATRHGFFVGGNFSDEQAPEPIRAIARSDGSDWLPLGNGILVAPGVGTGGVVEMISDGANLYVGGDFRYIHSGDRNSPQGVEVNHIARWDGLAWHALGAGVNGAVTALALDMDGSLVAGGVFTEAGGVPAGHVARWDGATWEPIGDGLADNVTSLAFLHNKLYAGGGRLAGRPSGGGAYLMQWAGGVWTAVDNGPDWCVHDLKAAGDSLIVGGAFNSVGGESMPYLAVWKPAEPSAAKPSEGSRIPSPGPRLEFYPNPTPGPAHFRVRLDRGSSIRLELFDVGGRSVMRQPFGWFPAGTRELDVILTDLPSGPFVAVVYVDGIPHSHGILFKAT